jgi:DNA-binding response OmpR family regulator
MADILLVDNDARLTELLALFLRRRGHEVRAAVSYADARERIAEREPELMLADLELGRERGRDELMRMERDRCLPRTLVVSGYLDRETEIALSEITAVVGTLRKPFDLEALESAIEASVRSDRPSGTSERAAVEGPGPRHMQAADGGFAT